MIRKLSLLLLLYWGWPVAAQNPASVFQLPNKTITVPCSDACTSFTVAVPHIRQSDDYMVQTIPYKPFAWADGGTELTALYSDDIFSSVINLPYPVCFYGITYNSLVVGSNSLLTFDVTNAGRRNNFRQTVSFSNTTPVSHSLCGGVPKTPWPPPITRKRPSWAFTTIFFLSTMVAGALNGALKEPHPNAGSSPATARCPCTVAPCFQATHQMVVYESTGVVEVYVQDKPVCTSWNEGLAILGMQNAARNKAVFPAGKNTSRWGSMGMNEAYRFTPSAGVSRFKKAELLSGSTVLATADTSTAANGSLNLHFNQVCPASDSDQYILKVTYQSCTNSTGEVSFDDTITIKKERLQVQLQTVNAGCLTGGSIAVNATGTVSAYSTASMAEPRSHRRSLQDCRRATIRLP
jgi:hypothetical protein